MTYSSLFFDYVLFFSHYLFNFQHEFERISDLLTQILPVSHMTNFTAQFNTCNHGFAALFWHRPSIHRFLQTALAGRYKT